MIGQRRFGGGARDGGFQARKTHVEAGPVHQGARETEGFGVAGFCEPLHGRAARKAEAEQFGRLVECFAHRVINGRAETPVVAKPAHFQELAMPARHQQQQVREGAIAAEPWAQRMALQMIDRDEGLVCGLRNRLAGHHAHQHAANQPRAGRGGHAVEVCIGNPGLRHGSGHRLVRNLRMRPRRNLRHDTLIGRVLFQLGMDHIGQQRHAPALNAQHSGGGLVAGRFNTEDSKRASHGAHIDLTGGGEKAAVQQYLTLTGKPQIALFGESLSETSFETIPVKWLEVARGWAAKTTLSIFGGPQVS